MTKIMKSLKDFGLLLSQDYCPWLVVWASHMRTDNAGLYAKHCQYRHSKWRY